MDVVQQLATRARCHIHEETFLAAEEALDEVCTVDDGLLLIKAVPTQVRSPDDGHDRLVVCLMAITGFEHEPEHSECAALVAHRALETLRQTTNVPVL